MAMPDRPNFQKGISGAGLSEFEAAFRGVPDHAVTTRCNAVRVAVRPAGNKIEAQPITVVDLGDQAVSAGNPTPETQAES